MVVRAEGVKEGEGGGGGGGKDEDRRGRERGEEGGRYEATDKLT